MLKNVHVSIVLDRSGSMEICRAEAVGAVNSYLRQVQDNPTMAARLSIVTFDSQSIDTVRDRMTANTCPELTMEEYQPRSGTPLLDAVGYSTSLLDCLSDKSERRIMAIVTDGLENASREYTRDSLKALLERKQHDEGWLVLYFGAGHDSWSQAKQIGIAPQHTADFSVHAFQAAATVLHAAGSRFVAARAGVAARDAGALTSAERASLHGAPLPNPLTNRDRKTFAKASVRS
jgi:uncharacterized protein YegL